MKPHWLTDKEIAELGECNPFDDITYPLRQYKSGWYYWDESWAYCFGGFKTREEAVKSLSQYGEEL
jgi:hypothetical protein